MPGGRGERLAVSLPLGRDFALARIGRLPPVAVPCFKMDAEMEEGPGVGLEDAPEPGLHGREIIRPRRARARADPLASLAHVEGIDVDSGIGVPPGLLREIPAAGLGRRNPKHSRKDGPAVEEERRAAVVRPDLGG